MKRITTGLMVALLALSASQAFAQTTSTAQQSSASTSTAQGTIQFLQTPANTHVSETIHNTPDAISGAYAAGGSQMNCGNTVQASGAGPGIAINIGGPHDMHSCVLEVFAAETARQSTITTDPLAKVQLQQATINARCQIDAETYHAMVDAGLYCSRKPKDYDSKEDAAPQVKDETKTYSVADTSSTRGASN